jgi:hypothetical protein
MTDFPDTPKDEATAAEDEARDLASTVAPTVAPADEKDAKKALNKAKRDAKRAKRIARDDAERAGLEARKEERRKRQEALKITVIDGNVVDSEGRVIRPYTRAEQFFDNKPLVYAILIVFILVCLAATVLLMQ